MEPDPPVVTGSSEADGHQGVLFPSLGGPDFASFSALGDVDRTLPPSLFATTTANASFTLRPVDSAQSSPRSRTISTTPGTSSPRRRARSATPEVDSASSLVADVQMTRSRLIISKTATLYPDPTTMIPFRSCIVGLRVVFHPLSQTRIKDADLEFRFLAPMGEPDCTPIIKALYPARLTGDETAEVKRTTSVAAGLSLGHDPFGQLSVNATRSMDVTWTAHSSVIGSGVETSTAMFSLVRDQYDLVRTGLDPSMDFALLLLLPSRTTRSFEAELTVQASVANNGIRDAARHLLGSPRIYRLIFDGETELGSFRLGQ